MTTSTSSSEDAAVHIWHLSLPIDLTSTLSDLCFSVINSAESKYAASCVPERQVEFLIARAGLRMLLSKYHPQIGPEKWVFETNAFGRPYLAPGQSSAALSFNLSHSGSAATYVISRGLQIGIDVERIDRSLDHCGIAASEFSDSENRELLLHHGSKLIGRFFEYWTLKESFIKAIGRGLAIPLRDFSFEIGSQGISVKTSPSLGLDPRHWYFRRFKLHSRYQVAVSARSEANRPQFLDMGRFDVAACKL